MELLNQFLHIYFWVHLVFAILVIIFNHNKDLSDKIHHLDFWSVVGWTIWFISWGY